MPALRPALLFPALTGLALLAAAWPAAADPLRDLGRALFFDPALSANGQQSCASCHDPANGFASAEAFAAGARPGHFGRRKPPSLAYQALSPVFHHRLEDGEILFIGGDMADGRARGHGATTPAVEQVLLPLMNPDEMALPHGACLAARACAAEGALMRGADPAVCQSAPDPAATCAQPAPAELDGATRAAIDLVQRALARFESSAEVMPFAARYDAYRAGKGDLTAREKAGLALFDGKAKCSACHVLTAAPGAAPLLTDFTFDNLGVPRNPANPWYQSPANPKGRAWVDRGLAETLEQDPLYAALAPDVEGAVKVPTLRNVWTGHPRHYMHNGWFTSLEGVVRFYNTRDVWPRCPSDWMTAAAALAARCWPAPENEATMNRDELGNLHLTEEEEGELVAFLKTLTDQPQ